MCYNKEMKYAKECLFKRHKQKEINKSLTIYMQERNIDSRIGILFHLKMLFIEIKMENKRKKKEFEEMIRYINFTRKI